MSIHRRGGTTSLQFFSNLEDKFVTMHETSKNPKFQTCPLARREAPAEGRRPKGEGANLDRHLVPYHVKQGESNLASSLYIYLFIYLYVGTRSFL